MARNMCCHGEEAGQNINIPLAYRSCTYLGSSSFSVRPSVRPDPYFVRPSSVWLFVDHCFPDPDSFRFLSAIFPFVVLVSQSWKNTSLHPLPVSQ
jgi:hypothetical protein